jgi:glycosyltransferase involved in cell wall biosynthesis
MTLTVLHAIPSLIGGGAERQLSLLAPELLRLGVCTHVAYLHPGANLTPLHGSDIKLHSISCSGNYDPRILFKLIRLINAIRPNLVQTWLPQMDIFAGLAALITGTPFILSERSSSLAYTWGWKTFLRRYIGFRANGVVANSESGIDYWSSVDGVRRVIRNGLSFQLIQASESASLFSLGLPNDARLLLFAGRLSAEKNIHKLLEALSIVLERHSDVVAVLFGDGPMHSELMAHINRLAVRGRIRLLGFTSDLWSWMRRADIFVSVSYFEGNPNSVLEAMAIGCPLVVSSIPQHLEILDECSAFLCDPYSPADIARVLDTVLSIPSLAAERAVIAQHRSEQWSIKNAANEYLDLYRELIYFRYPTKKDVST